MKAKGTCHQARRRKSDVVAGNVWMSGVAVYGLVGLNIVAASLVEVHTARTEERVVDEMCL